MIVCLALWFVWGRKLNPERLPTPVDSLNRLESLGAPDFELPNLEGKPFRLSSFKGKVVVLNFWATWCAPCVNEFPSMLRMAAQMKDKIVLVTVAADDRKQDVIDFIQSFNGYRANAIHLYDPSTKTAESFGTQKLPETYILKPDLKLAKKVVNSLEWDRAEVIGYLTELATSR